MWWRAESEGWTGGGETQNQGRRLRTWWPCAGESSWPREQPPSGSAASLSPTFPLALPDPLPWDSQCLLWPSLAAVWLQYQCLGLVWWKEPPKLGSNLGPGLTGCGLGCLTRTRGDNSLVHGGVAGSGTLCAAQHQTLGHSFLLWLWSLQLLSTALISCPLTLSPAASACWRPSS